VKLSPRDQLAPGAVEAQLGAVLAGSRVFVDVTIPRTTVTGKMRLLTDSEEEQVNFEIARWLKAAEVEETYLVAAGGLPVSTARARHTLALAIRDGSDPGRPLGTLAEWRECDHSQLGQLWRQYEDLIVQLDPAVVELTPHERAEIMAAVKKKDASLLLPCGAAKLTAFLLTTVAPPAS
jgi:hypothetical protein